MRLFYSTLLVGAVVLGLAAFVPSTTGQNSAVHELTISLPGGGTETIQYTGIVVPKVTVNPGPIELAWPAPIAFDFDPSFAAFDQLSADMDRQMDAFWRRAETMARWLDSQGLSEATLQNLSPGSSAYSVVSESYGNNFCTRMTQITTSADGGKPKVVSQTSGNCDAGHAGRLISAPTLSGAKTIPVHVAMPATPAPRSAL
jgi:hypothetical protein